MSDAPQMPACAVEMRGRLLSTAQTIAQRAGYSVRVVEQDGQALMVTQDWDPNRVNVRCQGSTVLSVESVG